MGEVERGFNLECCPILLDISIDIRYRPGDVVIYVGGLENEGEIDGPDEVGNGVEGHHAEESDVEEGYWENVVLEGIDGLLCVSFGVGFQGVWKRLQSRPRTTGTRKLVVG